MRVNDYPENTRTGGPARFARRSFVHGIAGAGLVIATATMTVIEIGEITYPFIACATGIASLVAMRTAANQAAQGA